MKNIIKNYSINRFVDCSIVKRALAVAGMTMGLAFGFAPSAQAYTPPEDLSPYFVSTDNEYETEYNPFAEPLTMPHWLSNLARHTCWTNYMGDFTNATISKIGFYPFWESAGTWFIATNRYYTVNMPKTYAEYFEKTQTGYWNRKDGLGNFVGNENTCLARIQKAAEAKLSGGGLGTDETVGENVTVALCQLLRPHEAGPKGHDQASDGGPHCCVMSNRFDSINCSFRARKEGTFAAGLRLDARSWYDCDKIIDFTYLKYGSQPERQKLQADAAPTVLVEVFNDQYGPGIRSCIATLDKVPEDWEGTYTLHNRDYGRTEVKETVRYVAYDGTPKMVETTTNRTRTVTHADAWPAFDEDVELDRGDVLIMKSLCYMADSAVQMLRAYHLPGNHTGYAADVEMTNLVKVQEAMHEIGYTDHSQCCFNRINRTGYSDRIERAIHDIYHELPTLFDKIDDSEALGLARTAYVNGLACFLDADAFIFGKATSATGKKIVGQRNPDQIHLIEFAEDDEDGGEWNIAGWREFAEKTYASLKGSGTAEAVQTLDLVDIGKALDIHAGSQGNKDAATHGVIDFSGLGPKKNGEITFDANAFFDGKILHDTVILDGSAITTNGPAYYVKTRRCTPDGESCYGPDMPVVLPYSNLVQRLHLALGPTTVSPTLAGLYPSGTLLGDLATMKAQFPASGVALRSGFAKMTDVYTCERTELESGESTNLVAGTTYTAAPTTEQGGAFNVQSGATLTGTNITFEGNQTAEYGGAIFNNGVVSLSHSSFAGNEATQGGAINNNGVASISHSSFKGNAVQSAGGAIGNLYVLNLNDVAFENNTAPMGGGGAIASTGTINLLGLVSLVTTNDTCLNFGLVNWDLTGETTGLLKGYENLINEYDGQSGTLQITVDDAIATPTNIVIATGDFSDIANKDTFTITNATSGAATTATIDGAVAVSADRWTGYQLKTVEAGETTNLVLSVIKYTCVQTVLKEGESTNLVEGTTYTAAPTTKNGGAFLLYSNATLTGTDVTFAGNSSAVSGGAIYNEGGVVDLTQATFKDNVAKGFGGAICNSGILNLNDVAFENNTANMAGGAIANMRTINLLGPVSLVTTNDTVVNMGLMNWDLTGESKGVLSGYQNLVNEFYSSTGTLKITVDDSTPTEIVIATGDFSDIANKDTFTIKNGDAEATVKIGGGPVPVGNKYYSLAIVGNELQLAVAKAVELSNVEIVDAAGVTNATGTVYVNNTQVTPNPDGSFTVPEGWPIKITYTAAENVLFGSCLKEKDLWLEDGITGDHAMTDDDKKSVTDKIQERWVYEREIALDTRERIVVAEPSEVLPFAYSTNNWGAVETTCTDVKCEYDGETIDIVSATNESGYADWQPTLGAYGKYKMTERFDIGMIIFDDHNITKDIYYSQPYALTWAMPHGTVTVTASGKQVAPGGEVLGYDIVHAVATPDEGYCLSRKWSVTNAVDGTIKVEGDLRFGMTFEMPTNDTVIAAEFIKATGATVNGEDLALGYGDGWEYDTAAGQLTLNGNATNRVDLSGTMPTGVKVVANIDASAQTKYIAINNFTNDVSDCDGVCAFAINAAMEVGVYMHGHNLLASGKDAPAIRKTGDGTAWIEFESGTEPGFLDARPGVDATTGALMPGIAVEGGEVQIWGGTYTSTVDPALVPDFGYYGQAAFDNGDGTWSAKGGVKVTYWIGNPVATSIVVTNVLTELLPVPAVPAADNCVFKGWKRPDGKYWDFATDVPDEFLGIGVFVLSLTNDFEEIGQTTPTSKVVPAGQTEPVVVETFEKALYLAPNGGEITVSNTNPVETVEKPLVIKKGNGANLDGIAPGEGLNKKVCDDGTVYIGETTNGVMVVEQDAGVTPGTGVTASNITEIVAASVIGEATTNEAAQAADALVASVKLKVTEKPDGNTNAKTVDITPILTLTTIKDGVATSETVTTNDFALSGEPVYVKIPCGDIVPVAVIHSHKGLATVLRRALDVADGFVYDAIGKTVTIAMTEFSDVTILGDEKDKAFEDQDPLTGTQSAGSFTLKDNIIGEAELTATKTIVFGANSQNDITDSLTLNAPEGGITNNGALAWNLCDDNTKARISPFDNVVQGPDAELLLLIDQNQAGDNEFTNSYVIADQAVGAVENGQEFILSCDAPSILNTLVAGGETLYIGAKAYSLNTNELGQLVLKIAMGRFDVVYHYYDDDNWGLADAVRTNQFYVNKGLTLTNDWNDTNEYPLYGNAWGGTYKRTFIGWTATNEWYDAYADVDVTWGVEKGWDNPGWGYAVGYEPDGLTDSIPMWTLGNQELWARWTFVDTWNVGINASADVKAILNESTGEFILTGTVENAEMANMLSPYGKTDPEDDGVAPWYCNSRQLITTVRVAANVSHLGYFAFCDCANLNEVFFAGTVPGKVSTLAFYNCKTAVGYYEPEFEEAWTNAIDKATGKWGNLVMYNRADVPQFAEAGAYVMMDVNGKAQLSVAPGVTKVTVTSNPKGYVIVAPNGVTVKDAPYVPQGRTEVKVSNLSVGNGTVTLFITGTPGAIYGTKSLTDPKWDEMTIKTVTTNEDGTTTVTIESGDYRFFSPVNPQE